MRQHHRGALLTVSSALVAVAPKCPICFLAYFGIFGVASASATAYRTWLPLVAAIWLILTITILLFPLKEVRYCPLLLGALAALAVFAGKFLLDNRVLVFSGIAGLVIATIWRSRSRRSIATALCERCE